VPTPVRPGSASVVDPEDDLPSDTYAGDFETTLIPHYDSSDSGSVRSSSSGFGLLGKHEPLPYQPQSTGRHSVFAAEEVDDSFHLGLAAVRVDDRRCITVVFGYLEAAMQRGDDVIDGMNCLDAAQWMQAGWEYRGMGRSVTPALCRCIAVAATAPAAAPRPSSPAPPSKCRRLTRPAPGSPGSDGGVVGASGSSVIRRSPRPATSTCGQVHQHVPPTRQTRSVVLKSSSSGRVVGDQ